MEKNREIRVNNEIISMNENQTILQAALDAGLNFPHLCRVGSCGKCRCRLRSGKVKQAAGARFEFTQEEKNQGHILACQSRLSSNDLETIAVEVLLEEVDFNGEVAIPKSKRPRAHLGHYLKFLFFQFFGLGSAVILLLGGEWTTIGLFVLVFSLTVGDLISGDDLSTPDYKASWFLTFSLWTALPVVSFVVFCALWVFAPGDPFQFGLLVSNWTGFDLLAAKSMTVGGHAVSAFILTGLMIGFAGTIPAHELTHRTWDPISMIIGRWLLAFSFDTGFSIEHVYGHHRYVSTKYDPATAPRGRNVYFHIIASTIKGNISAWEIESNRLQQFKQRVFSWRNIYLRGQLMSLVLLGGAYTIDGWASVGYLLGLAIFGKSLLEIVNYMEHYGMVRNPDLPVQPRHSWNTNSRLTSWSMFNLSRHSHHHAQGEIPFGDLLPLKDAPVMIGGYLSTMIVTLIPPLWFMLMKPKLENWDQNFASPEELAILEGSD